MTNITETELQHLRYTEEKYNKVKLWRNRATQNWRMKNREKYNESMRLKYLEKRNSPEFMEKNRENAKKHYDKNKNIS
tara:strand:+ start:303 stop:536 length:234 start_codon:yes stop_codon:yes gene_type:complete